MLRQVVADALERNSLGTSVTVDPAEDQIDDQKAKAWWVWKREMVMVCDEGRCIWALNYIICFTLYHGVFVILPKWLGCSCWRCLGDLYDLLTPVEHPAG